MLMLSVNLAVLAFTVGEQPWKDPNVQKLAVINEVGFSLVVALILGCEAFATTTSIANVLGWAIIMVVTFVVVVIFVVVVNSNDDDAYAGQQDEQHSEQDQDERDNNKDQKQDQV